MIRASCLVLALALAAGAAAGCAHRPPRNDEVTAPLRPADLDALDGRAQAPSVAPEDDPPQVVEPAPASGGAEAAGGAK
jgi:hypothetical protein